MNVDIVTATAIYTAKEFIQKIINPPLEEVGNIMADEIRFFRFKNQVQKLTRVDEYLKSHNIKTRKVALKVLLPLLEDCSLEEEVSLQEKWTALIANTVSEGSDINNTLMSNILSQVSKQDADVFEFICEKCSTSSKTETGESKVWISFRERKSIYMTNLHSKFKDLDLSLENLIRLRLIKDERTDTFSVELVSLTELGHRFMNACRFPF